jgi:hypothetical protein
VSLCGAQSAVEPPGRRITGRLNTRARSTGIH